MQGDEIEKLADRLYDLACSDYAEPDPTTGEAFDATGRLIVEASIALTGVGKLLNKARSEALEEAAKVVEASGLMPAHLVGALSQLAAAIRNLKP